MTANLPATVHLCGICDGQTQPNGTCLDTGCPGSRRLPAETLERLGLTADAVIVPLAHIPPPVNTDPTACDVCGCSYCTCEEEEEVSRRVATKIETTKYVKGKTLCVLLVTRGGPPFPMSVNLHGHPDTDLTGPLEEGEFVLKHDLLNSAVLEEVLEAGLVEDTGKRCSYGYVTDALILRLAEAPVKTDPRNFR